MPALLTLGTSLLSLSKQGWFYIFNHGFVFVGDRLRYQSVRITASILLSLTGEPFEVEVAGGPQFGNAFLVRPGVWRSVKAEVPMVSIGLCPTHENYRAFSLSEESTDLWPLSRTAFADFDDRFQAARDGLISPRQAGQMGLRIVARAKELLPAPAPLDARIEQVRAVIDAAPDTSMKRLASEVDLSYHRLSHLFSQEMGITLRMYALSRKLDLAAMMAGQGLNLTQIAVGSGFADSAHFSRMWLRMAGSPPSQTLNSHKVGIRSVFGSQH